MYYLQCILTSARQHLRPATALERAIMWIKVIIVFLFVALLISLSSGFVFLVKDRGNTQRTWYALSVRLVLAALLMGFLIFGIYTGRLGSNAPWDARHFAPNVTDDKNTELKSTEPNK
jgi:hypothetical protein